VNGISDAVAISAGGTHGCALKRNGTVWCWGGDWTGALGDGGVAHQTCLNGDCSPTPVQVSGLTNAVAVSAGEGHNCALRADGTAWCWGDNSRAELGDGLFVHQAGAFGDCSPTPVQVSGLTNAVAVSAGGGHSCALRADGTAWCWGDDHYAELGDGGVAHPACLNGDCSPTPVEVSGLTNAVAVSAGGGHSCALRADGTAWCWGDNRQGALGDGALQHHACHDGDCASTPVHVSGLTGVASISAGYLSSCALGADGTAWCWGDNRSRQLGDGVFLHGYFPGTSTDCSLTPVQVKL